MLGKFPLKCTLKKIIFIISLIIEPQNGSNLRPLGILDHIMLFLH